MSGELTGRSARIAPVLWKVTYLALGAVDHVVLGDQDDDSYRVVVTVVGNGDEAPELDAQVIYPCRACGWAGTCHGGEDCHS